MRADSLKTSCNNATCRGMSHEIEKALPFAFAVVRIPTASAAPEL